jgi:hypothetical protein
VTKAIALAVLCTIAAGSSAQTRKGPGMQEKIKSAAEQLDEFDKTPKVEHLERAVEALEEVDVLAAKDTAERLKVRREMLTAWCRALGDLDRLKDPKFDPEDTPQLNVVPSPGPGGAMDTPSVNPKDIADPRARKQYEAALEANRKKKSERRVQFLVTELEDRAMERAKRLIERMYTSAAADRKEVEAVFGETRLGDGRRAKLMKAQ